jgi:hypothetical protein
VEAVFDLKNGRLSGSLSREAGICAGSGGERKRVILTGIWIDNRLQPSLRIAAPRFPACQGFPWPLLIAPS